RLLRRRPGAALDGEGYYGALVVPNQRLHLLNRLALERGAVDRHDQIAGLQPRLCTRRVRDHGVDSDGVVAAAAQIYADANARGVVQAVVLGLGLVRRLEAAVSGITKRLYHRVDGRIGHLPLIEAARHDVVLVNVVPRLDNKVLLAVGRHIVGTIYVE